MTQHNIICIQEREFIEQICIDKTTKRQIPIDTVCSTLHKQGLLIKNERHNCWHHWLPSHPEAGFFYMVKKADKHESEISQ